MGRTQGRGSGTQAQAGLAHCRERAAPCRSCCVIREDAPRSGALSTLNASYASASEYYLMNIYGKEASAYYDLQHGLRMLRRGEERVSDRSILLKEVR